MGKGRDAVDTIRGYYYQFDYYILQLMGLKKETDTVTIEGIEDVDIFDENGVAAVQCKYYMKTEYNHSVIAKPIRLMLRDFVNRSPQNRKIRYKLYCKYKSGQDKYPGTLTVEFAKKNLFTYTENEEVHVLHKELNLTDEDIDEFLNRLDVNIYAEDYWEQQEKIINGLEKIFQCEKFEAEYYYYNNALRLVKEKAVQQSKNDRSVSKEEFLRKINKKEMLFDKWYLQYKGIHEYCADIKKKYFSPTNISPYERFFLIEYDCMIDDLKLIALIEKIAEKWSKLSIRESKPFCPYVYINGISQERLITLKKKLQHENIRLLDGYDFLGADFFVDSIIRKPNNDNKVKVKIINSIENLNMILEKTVGIKKIYQFYLHEPFYTNQKDLCYMIQILKTEDISMMI